MQNASAKKHVAKIKNQLKTSAIEKERVEPPEIDVLKLER